MIFEDGATLLVHLFYLSLAGRRSQQVMERRLRFQQLVEGLLMIPTGATARKTSGLDLTKSGRKGVVVTGPYHRNDVHVEDCKLRPKALNATPAQTDPASTAVRCWLPPFHPPPVRGGQYARPLQICVGLFRLPNSLHRNMPWEQFAVLVLLSATFEQKA
eukprot:SM000259S08753  [mRNA]  locus=s259:47257:50454:- [translate_table: standard]